MLSGSSVALGRAKEQVRWVQALRGRLEAGGTVRARLKGRLEGLCRYMRDDG